MKESITTTVLTVFGTVISGVLVFIIGQILTTIWLQPLQKYKELKQKIAEALSYLAIFYANTIDLATAKEEQIKKYKNASDNIRKLSCELNGFIETLSIVKIGIPSKKDLQKASSELMRLSNAFFSPYNCSPKEEDNDANRETADRIRNYLKMYPKE